MVEQLYLAPDWIGRGLGGRLLDLAKARRPERPRPLLLPGQRAGPARSTSVTGSQAIAFGDGSGQRGAPARHPLRLAPAMTARSIPASTSGRPTARRSRSSGPGRPTGRRSSSSTATTADHTTFRVVGPLLGATLRRSTPSTAAAAAPRATRCRTRSSASSRTSPRSRRPSPASRTAAPSMSSATRYGGRCALGAALLTPADPPGRLVRGRPDAARRRATTPPGSTSELRALLAAGRPRRRCSRRS